MAKQTFTTGQVLTAAQMTSLQQTAMGGGSASTKTASYVLVAADAGTVIQMNSASATTITVNTSLFSAGDSVQIQNIGTGTCTITAGTATVNSAGSLAVTQYDGGFLYFSSASSAIWFDYTQAGTTFPLTTKGDLYTFSTTGARLAVGTNGQTLVADSAEATGLKWATASSGALTYVGGSTFSASATVNVNNLFSATYSNYRAYLFFNASANSGVIKMRMRVSGSDDTNSTYSYQIGTYQNETYKTYAASSFELNPQYINPGVLSFDIFNPFASERTIYTATGLQNFGSTDLAANFFAGVFTNTTSFTGLTLFSSNATTLTGTLRVYGLANS